MAVISFNSNIPALQAQRRLAEGNSHLRHTYERLSSGLRVVKASDDAAGLAVASSLRVDARVYQQAVRNLNDGVSLLNIAEGAVNELRSILFRLRELTTQSANGTVADSQRIAIEAESQALIGEYNRITSVTDFNGLRLLDGTLTALTLQAGYRTDGQLSIALGQAIQRELGTENTTVGIGTFETAITFAAGTAHVSDIPRFGDLNGDGLLDVVSSSYADDVVRVRLGNGNGTFRSQVSYSSGDGAYWVTLSDLNNDGVLDLTTTSRIDDRLMIRLGNGNGSFKQRVDYSAHAPINAEAVDMNRDGMLDLVVSERGAAKVLIRLGNGNGTFRAEQTFVATAGGGFSTHALEVADFDGDGALDVVVVDQNGAQYLQVLLGNGNGTLKARVSYDLATGGGWPKAGDLNGDGIVDIVTAVPGSNKVEVYLGNGNGTFKARVSYDAGAGANFPQLRDLNGDDVLDIIVTAANEVNVLFGNGNGTFKSRTSSPSSVTSFLTLADVNGDGVLDVAATGGGSVGVLFAKTTTITSLGYIDLSTREGALAAMAVIDNARVAAANELAAIGAFQSRLGTALRNLQQTVEHDSTAESRIMDIDAAEEAAALVKGKILEEATSAILGQANQLPSLLLGLLTEG